MRKATINTQWMWIWIEDKGKNCYEWVYEWISGVTRAIGKATILYDECEFGIEVLWDSSKYWKWRKIDDIECVND